MYKNRYVWIRIYLYRKLIYYTDIHWLLSFLSTCTCSTIIVHDCEVENYVDFFAQRFPLSLTPLKAHELKWLLWFANRIVSPAYNPSSRTEPTRPICENCLAFLLTSFTRTSMLPLSRNYIFESAPTCTLLIAATLRTVIHRFPTKLVHLTLTVIWWSFFL